MNKYIFGIIRVTNGIIKISMLKAVHMNTVRIGMPVYLSPYTEITIERGTKVEIGRNFKMRSASKIRVRKGASLRIGDSFNMSGRNWITVRESVEIGDNVTFGPGTMIYDHDHDFTTINGIREGKYLTTPVKIGNNVWIGADCLILRGTVIGDNCVVGAGTILKGKYGSDQLIYQKRENVINTRKYS